MVQLASKRQKQDKPAEERSTSGSKFLEEARGRLAEVIGQYAVAQVYEAYETFEELFADLESDVWQEADKLLKESYRNGRRGGRGQRR